MMKFGSAFVLSVIAFATVAAQSGRSTGYSESGDAKIIAKTNPTSANDDRDVVRVETDLITIPVRITSRDGKAVPNVGKNEFKVYENGVEQQIAYFSNDEQPFTVALMLDTSYSTVFQLQEIQAAARIFTLKLRDHDRVMVVSFDEEPRVLCEANSDRRILQMAIAGSKIASGTSLYDALAQVKTKLESVPGRKAIVLLTDGVDTSSKSANAASVASNFAGEDVIVYPMQYDTFDDVQRSRHKDAEIKYDDDDRPYVVKAPPQKGERTQDYDAAREFMTSLADNSGGHVYRVSSTTNLNDAFSRIADELRKIYSIGYYPTEDRKSGAVYDIKVRVYRPNLKITARNR